MVTQRRQSAAPGDSAVQPPGADGLGVSGHGVPRQWRWLLPLAMAAATAAWLAGITSGEMTGGLRILLMAAGALFTATAAAVPMWQQVRATWAHAEAVAAAQSARATMRIAMEDALDPFAALLLQLATARGKEKSLLRGEAIQLALTTISQMGEFGGMDDPSGPRRLRVSFFALSPGPPRALVPHSYAGRSGAPTVSFDERTRAGQFLLRIADHGWLVIDDTARLRLPVRLDDEQEYRTFAAGPVQGPEGEPVGLLVVDTLTPGELMALDLPLVRLLARLLSLALQT